MPRLTARLLGALRLIGSAVDYGGRLIADGNRSKLAWISPRRLAAPPNQNRSRSGGGLAQAQPVGEAFVVNPSEIDGFEDASYPGPGDAVRYSFIFRISSIASPASSGRSLENIPSGFARTNSACLVGSITPQMNT